ncbi:tetratricopeptide repeat-containing sensor histidine kinase [Danxiaibacter flavus]|uniref:histidine kinase n=1 Tax=Danxiaibacter flavus TaxID=3049108 RepID=A0ABV3ZDC9_9BACT|nr:tetratricopeptide repeat-containing sensor histidine kinase [Chitinophagaceae bacterium DXS]
MKTLTGCFLLVLSLICGRGLGQKNEIIETLKNISNHTTDDSLKAGMLIDASFLYQAYNLDSASFYALRAIDIANAFHNKKLLCDAYNQQASNYVWKYAYDSALHMYLRSIEIANKHGYQTSLFNAYVGIAYLFEVSASWDRAFYYNRKAMEIASATQMPDQKAYAYHGMSSVYSAMHNNEDAEKQIKMALPLFRETKNEDRVATCYLDLARLCTVSNRFTEGIMLLDSAVFIFKQLDEPLQIAEAYEAYASIFALQKQTAAAKSYYTQALDIYTANQMEASKYNSYLGLANVYFQTEDYVNAKKLLIEANGWFKQHHEDEKQLEALLQLARVDSVTNVPQQAFSYLSEYSQLAEKVNRNKRDRYARQLLIEYEVDKKEKENALLQAQNNRNKNALVIFIVTGVLLFFALGLMYLLYLQKKKLLRRLEINTIHKEEINKQLAESNHIKNQLFSILAHDLRDPLANTLHLIKTLKTSDVSESDFKLMTNHLENDLTYNNELLQNMLNWAKSQMEGIVLYRKKIDLQQIVNENIALFNTLASKKNLTVSNLIPADTFIYADENILRLALRNTISNAIKFSFENQEIRLFTTNNCEGYVTLKVQDSGAGISEQRLATIFTGQIKSTRGTQKEKGAGLGLLITKEMMDYMETPLWIESTEGEGTDVFMKLKQVV